MDNVKQAGKMFALAGSIFDAFGKKSTLSKTNKYMILGGVFLFAVLLIEKKIKL